MRKLITLIILFKLSHISIAQTGFYLTFGGPYSDEGLYLFQDSNNQYIISGDSGEAGGTGDYYFLKTDSSGNLLLSKTYGNFPHEIARCVKPAKDGGYVLYGNLNEAWFLKISDSGDSLASAFMLGTNAHRYGISIVALPDTSYVLGTVDDGNGWLNPYQLIKLDKNLNGVWWPYKDVINSTYFGGYGGSLQYTNDGGFIIGGTDELNGQTQDVMSLVKTDSGGNVLWSKQFSGVSGCFGNCVCQCSDGGYAVAGTTDSYGAGAFDMYIVRTDANGDSLWSHTFGGSGDESIASIQQTSDSGFVLFGQSNTYSGDRDAILIKINSTGDSTWQKRYGGTGTELINHGIICNDGGFACVGSTTSTPNGDQDLLFIKTDSYGNILNTNANPLFSEKTEIYPNPFDEFLSIKIHSKFYLEIMNSFGEIVKACSVEEPVLINTSDFRRGVYFVTLFNEYGRNSQVLIK